MAKNGSSRCFFGQQRVCLKTIAAQSAVGHILLATTQFLPFLAKSDRVLLVIATLLGFSPFYVPFRGDYSATLTDQHGSQEQRKKKKLCGMLRRSNVDTFIFSLNN